MHSTTTYFIVLTGTLVLLATVLGACLVVLVSIRRDKRALKREQRILLEKKEVEQKLLESKCLAILGALSGGVTYYLNSSLVSIQDLLALMQAEAGKGVDTKGLVRLISQELHQALRISGRMKQVLPMDEVKLRPISVSNILESLTNSIEQILPPEFELVVTNDSELLAIMGDSTLLGRILMNLISNAADAMPGGGTINIRLGKLTEDQSREYETDQGQGRPWLSLEVSDTGCGMDPAVVKRVYDPFFSTKERGDRVGLGLSFVRGVIEIFNGRVVITSSLGRGTTASLLIPTLSASSAAGLEDDSALEFLEPDVMYFDGVSPQLTSSQIGRA
ncbi:MAG: ATP-binding protein [Candidatus Neomarinimicrobiota bacterium]